jgi:hypothetical protein
VLDADELWLKGCILDARTGKERRRIGGSTSQVTPNSRRYRIASASDHRWGDFMAFDVIDRESGKTVGKGFLAEPRPEGEVLERHIKLWGLPEIQFGRTHGSCWGNRIFIRSHDYLWCIGDPQQPWGALDEQ